MNVRECPVLTTCPYCQALIPIFTMRAAVTGWWRKKIDLTLDGDPADLVAHLWQHDLEKETTA
jgi:hypothetical protein